MQISITGVAPHVDATYDLDWTQLTNRELNEMKRISGVRPTEMLDALIAGDAAFACSMAIIAARRAGKLIPEDVILDSVGGNIKFLFEGTSDVPPTRPKRNSGKSSRSSGSASKKSSASPARRRSRSGEPT